MPKDTDDLLAEILETLEEIRNALHDQNKTLEEILSVMPRDER